MLKDTVDRLKALVQGDGTREQLLADIELTATKLETYVEKMTPMDQAFTGLTLEIDRLLRDSEDPARFARVERLSQIAQKLKRESITGVDDLVNQECGFGPNGGGVIMNQGGGIRRANYAGGYVGAGAPYGMAQDPDGDPLLDGLREIAQVNRTPAAVQRAQELRDLAQARKDLIEGDLDTAAVDARIQELQTALQPPPPPQPENTP